jgi:hypothetical protein
MVIAASFQLLAFACWGRIFFGGAGRKEKL